MMTTEVIREQIVVGTWKLTYVDETPPVASTEESAERWGDSDAGETTVMFMPGGGLIATSTGSPATVLGAWSMSSDQEFQARFVVYDFSTQLKFLVKSEGRMTGSVDGDRLHGSFSFDAYDPSGKHLEVEVGKVEGVRLKV
jgi:hypothetical protein